MTTPTIDELQDRICDLESEILDMRTEILEIQALLNNSFYGMISFV